jgi:hypothetical protein
VILLLVGLLVVGLGLATWNLASFQGSDLVGPGPNPGAAAAAGPSATQDQPSSPESPAPSTAGAAGPPPEIAGIQAIDPEGDGNENGGSAPRAIDGDAGTAWRSERYGTPEFGGIKKGVGLVVDLADPSRVRQVTLQAPGTGGSVELRTAPGPGLDGSQVVATADIEGGPVVLTPARPVSTRYLVVWFTRVPRAEDGDNRILVEEIGVR